MAITKRMVDMMGGEILAESEKGVGLTCTVAIPLQQSTKEDEVSELASLEDVSVAGLRVLIAEDQEINAGILAELLEMEEVTSEWVGLASLGAIPWDGL